MSDQDSSFDTHIAIFYDILWLPSVFGNKDCRFSHMPLLS